MEGCLFCSMIDGSIPVKTVYEDEHVIAFDDIAPQAPVHTLVIPREHVADISAADEELLGHLFAAVPAVAAVKGVDESGYRVIVNTGADAGQTVPHLHVHIIGGRHLGHGMVG